MKKILHIIKIGEDLMDDTNEIAKVLDIFSALDSPKILVHGKGQNATHIASKLAHLDHLINNLNLDNVSYIKILEMLYSSMINNTLVGQLQARGVNGIGLSGADMNTIETEKVQPTEFGQAYGLISKINSNAINQLLEIGAVPVFCTITHNNEGELLYTSDDDIATQIAIAMNDYYQVQLHFCSVDEGILSDNPDSDIPLTHISKNKYQQYLDDYLIPHGMVPQIDAAFKAKESKVHQVKIGNIDAVDPNSKTQGTTIGS